MKPYEDITFAIVVWNDAERLRPLLEHVRPYFKTLAVAVQESPDDTLDVAMELADIIVKDEHHGFGDASFGPKLLPQIQSRWTFKCDADEWPTESLLEHLGTYVEQADEANTRGVWIPFRSWVEGQEYEEQHSHLRLFHTKAGWSATLHSRPEINDGIKGTVGHLLHRRSLDEMMLDYLAYYDIGKGNPGWDAHNRLMMKSACDGVAAVKGWRYVRSFEWWPAVRAAAYAGKEPRMKVYCAGATRNGTRLLFDIVTAMGHDAVHAVLPGYHSLPEGGPDLANPVWWSVSQMQEMYGEGQWIIISRDPRYAAQSALASGRIDDLDEYEEIASRVNMAFSDEGFEAFHVKYEDLVADPIGQTGLIADYLGGGKPVPASGIFDANEKHREAVEAMGPAKPEPEPEIEQPKKQPKRSKSVEEADATDAEVTVDAEITESEEEKEA